MQARVACVTEKSDDSSFLSGFRVRHEKRDKGRSDTRATGDESLACGGEGRRREATAGADKTASHLVPHLAT